MRARISHPTHPATTDGRYLPIANSRAASLSLSRSDPTSAAQLLDRDPAPL